MPAFSSMPRVGETQVWPSRTLWIAGTKSMVRRGFTTYPRAPVENAALTSWEWVWAVRNITFVLVPDFLRREAASMPLTIGMEMSRRTTSGSRLATACSACAPLSTAHDFKINGQQPCYRLQDCLRVISQQDTCVSYEFSSSSGSVLAGARFRRQRNENGYLSSKSRLRADGDRASQQVDAFPHTDQAETLATYGCFETEALS